jgi:arylsulfatase
MKPAACALAVLLTATAAYSQEKCDAGTTPKFPGVIGRTAADSVPSPYEPTRPPPGSPNVLYIVLDDLGFGDLGCHGSSVSTPYIDALAKGGLQFNNFQSKAICSPSRASLLTGRNAHSVGMKELAGGDQGYPHTRGRVPATAANVAQILNRNGYSTFAVGKWHLVPREDMTPAGDRTHWPLQKGFDRFYGFLSGWTDQYRPDLVIDNHAVDPPTREGYHFSEDIVDQALSMLQGKIEADAEKPFFLYLAFGATHAPIQVPKRYIEKYKGAFDDGWDAVRESRYRRQLELGVIPAGSELPPRNPGDPAWSDLSDKERKVYARFMEAFAGFLEHTDDQIGRVLDFLKAKGLLENTLIVLVSDNGGAPEAGVKGNFAHSYGDRMTVDEMYARLDELGGPTTQPLYPRPWAMASSAPFKYYKLWPFNGGVRTPMIVSWPKRLHQHGLRRQFVDIIDVTPTVLDYVGIEPPEAFDGVCQMPMQGKSLRAVFEDPNAPAPRDTQFFELWGSRGIYHKGWKAVAFHVPGTDFDSDRWELYNETTDFTESVDLAGQQPAKLKQLQDLWWEEAAKNGALPLLEASRGRQRTYDQILPDSSSRPK